MRALISVTDKTGLIPFATRLCQIQMQIISTGGTCRAILAADLPCTAVESVTGFPEILSGRVKTLHPKIAGGILADLNQPQHLADLASHGISPINLVVVNLYNFAGNPSINEIDIGGPNMLREAAKNHEFVTVVCDPADYDEVAEHLEHGHVPEAVRFRLAAKAFEATARYDRMIADHFREKYEANERVADGARH